MSSNGPHGHTAALQGELETLEDLAETSGKGWDGVEGRSELWMETTAMGADLRTFPITTQQVGGWVDENPSLHSRPEPSLLFHLLWLKETAAPDRLMKNSLRETGNDSLVLG